MTTADPSWLIVGASRNLPTRPDRNLLIFILQLIELVINAVLGEQGPVTLPNGAVAISSDGTISVNGSVVDKLRLAEFPPGTNLTAMGNATYGVPAGSAVAAADSSVRQGMLEGSNVSPTEGVVQLLTVQRSAEMLGRAFSALDGQLNQIAVQELPKV